MFRDARSGSVVLVAEPPPRRSRTKGRSPVAATRSPARRTRGRAMVPPPGSAARSAWPAGPRRPERNAPSSYGSRARRARPAMAAASARPSKAHPIRRAPRRAGRDARARDASRRCRSLGRTYPRSAARASSCRRTAPRRSRGRVTGARADRSPCGDDVRAVSQRTVFRARSDSATMMSSPQ